MRTTRVLLIAALLPITGCQAVGNWATVRVSPIDWGESRQASFIMTPDSGGRPTIAMQIDGRELPVTIDSGSSGGLIARPIAEELGARINDRRGKVNGQSAKVARDIPLQFGEYEMEVDLVVHEGTFPAPVVLGAYLFLQSIVDMDFANRTLSIIHPKRFEPPDAQPIPVKLQAGVPTVELEVAGHEQTLCAIVDTGFNGGLLVTDETVSEFGLVRDPTRGPATTSGPLSERVQRPALMPLDELRLGEFVFSDVRVINYPGLDKRCSNLLGMAVLSRYRVIFHMGERRFWLLPRVPQES